MSPLDTAAFIRRIDELLSSQLPNDTEPNIYAAAVQKYQSTLTLVTALYGATSHQAQTLLSADATARKYVGHLSSNFPNVVLPVILGILRAMRADIEAGLIGNVAQRAAGEVLGDMLGLAKEAMDLSTEPAKNVAAVLTAAAYEESREPNAPDQSRSAPAERSYRR